MTTITNSIGYYEIDVFGGFFDITASNNEYYPETINDIYVKENDTNHWENFSLIKLISSLRIGPISGGLGVNTVIENVGDGSAYDIEWFITLEGGRVLRNRRIATGIISEIKPQSIVFINNRQNGFYLGFGQIKITVIVKLPDGSNISKSTTALLLGSIVTLTDVGFPLRKKVSGHVTDNTSGRPVRLARVIAKPLGGILKRRTRTRILFQRAGKYQFRLIPGHYEITVKRLGYYPQTKTIAVSAYPVVEDFVLIRR
jgi:hypothetical protein